MQRERFDEYIRRFHARDYDGLLEFYGPDPEVIFAGYALRGRAAIKSFYAFLHQYLRESVTVDRYVADTHTIALEATVRLEGIRDLTSDILEQHGFGRLVSMPAGVVVELPQYIHYHLDHGKFVSARCAMFEPPRD